MSLPRQSACGHMRLEAAENDELYKSFKRLVYFTWYCPSAGLGGRLSGDGIRILDRDRPSGGSDFRCSGNGSPWSPAPGRAPRPAAGSGTRCGETCSACTGRASHGAPEGAWPGRHPLRERRHRRALGRAAPASGPACPKAAPEPGLTAVNASSRATPRAPTPAQVARPRPPLAGAVRDAQPAPRGTEAGDGASATSTDDRLGSESDHGHGPAGEHPPPAREGGSWSAWGSRWVASPHGPASPWGGRVPSGHRSPSRASCTPGRGAARHGLAPRR